MYRITYRTASKHRPFNMKLFCGAVMILAVASLAQAQSVRKHEPPPPPPRVRIEVEKRGVIVVELFTEKTPKTAAHFLALVRRKFYDKTLFHSVVKGFVASAGDPKSRSIDGSKLVGLSDLQVIQKYNLGSGGSGSTVPLEPGYSHDKGTIALQHSIRNIDSGDSIFFFNLTDNQSNEGGFTSFGRIVQGLDVMDKINQGDRIASIRIVEPPSTHPDKKSPPKPGK